MAAYCDKADLLTGDIPLAGKYGDGTSFCQLAADEIDAQVGHIYTTPVTFVDDADPKSRPAQLLLKKINILLASGRIILDMAAGGEDDNLHAYGESMRREAVALLNQISSGVIDLAGAEKLPDTADDLNTGPLVHNEDPYSLVEDFYKRSASPIGFMRPAMRPYDDPVQAN